VMEGGRVKDAEAPRPIAGFPFSIVDYRVRKQKLVEAVFHIPLGVLIE